tara:strand:+ start:1235 stop:2257 length:1023 start_codon:yes stop_codon:yes gene_type:complete
LKLFFSYNDLIESVPRSYLSDWAKPLFPTYRHSLYGLDPKDLEYCKQKSDADGFLLPFTWNYYMDRGCVNDALTLIEEYRKWSKPIYTWIGGDHFYRIPEGDFILFCHNGYQSIRRNNEYAYPVIIRDPLKYLNLSKIRILPKDEKPKIGFCGLANKNWIDGNWRACKNTIFKLVNSIRKPYLDLSHPISGASLRRTTLKILSNSNDVKTNFLIRYKSGGQTVNTEKNKLQFWENMLVSPYILCIRGTGNYSARFYEALALGRIPVFVNTDCILPLDDKINWKQHCVIINEKDLDSLGEIITNFHNNLSSDGYCELQRANRELWVKNLTFHGFYHNISGH